MSGSSDFGRGAVTINPDWGRFVARPSPAPAGPPYNTVVKPRPSPPPPARRLTVLKPGVARRPQLAQAGLVDFLRVVVIPVVLGGGRTRFEGVKGRPELQLFSTRGFLNANVLLCYGPRRVRPRPRSLRRCQYSVGPHDPA